MLDHLDTLKEVLIKEFYQLYDHYSDDGIYACSLVFDEFLRVDYLAISTERSIFNDQEDRAQYLSETERWNVAKWRYRTVHSSNNGMTQFRALLDSYFKNQHSFGNPLLEHSKTDLTFKLADALLNFRLCHGTTAINLSCHCCDMLDQFLDIKIGIDKMRFQR
jgi:hypothetical protein